MEKTESVVTAVTKSGVYRFDADGFAVSDSIVSIKRGSGVVAMVAVSDLVCVFFESSYLHPEKKRQALGK